MIEQVEHHFSDGFLYHYEIEEIEATQKLERIAFRLEAHIPPKPEWGDDTWEKSDYWEHGEDGWYLKSKGRDTVRENIEKVQRWKRERVHFAIQCVIAAVTLVGAISGWIAFYLKD